MVRRTQHLAIGRAERAEYRDCRPAPGQTDITTGPRLRTSLLGARVATTAAQDASIPDILSRVDRIEHRLELREQN